MAFVFFVPFGTPSVFGESLFVDTTPTGNTGGGEDDLLSYAMPGGTLGTNLDLLEVHAWGRFIGDSSRTLTIRLYFGATLLITSGGIVIPTVSGGYSWDIRATVVRNDATNQEAGSLQAIQFGLQFSPLRTTPAETLSSAVTIRVTGEASDSASDTAICSGLVVQRMAAP